MTNSSVSSADATLPGPPRVLLHLLPPHANEDAAWLFFDTHKLDGLVDDINLITEEIMDAASLSILFSRRRLVHYVQSLQRIKPWCTPDAQSAIGILESVWVVLWRDNLSLLSKHDWQCLEDETEAVDVEMATIKSVPFTVDESKIPYFSWIMQRTVSAKSTQPCGSCRAF
ncbi:hypothetical protein EMMF5_004863 [Cystobasidiomycetes sp. EMM_F5]